MFYYYFKVFLIKMHTTKTTFDVVLIPQFKLKTITLKNQKNIFSVNWTKTAESTNFLLRQVFELQAKLIINDELIKLTGHSVSNQQVTKTRLQTILKTSQIAFQHMCRQDSKFYCPISPRS